MYSLFKNLCAITLSVTAATALATPTHYITHNDTDLLTNVIVNGTESPFPTFPHSTRKIAWRMVKLGCGRAPNGMCAVLIKIRTDTSDPIEIGTLYMDMNSGELTPQSISANGYTVNVLGAAEVAIAQK